MMPICKPRFAIKIARRLGESSCPRTRKLSTARLTSKMPTVRAMTFAVSLGAAYLTLLINTEGASNANKPIKSVIVEVTVRNAFLFMMTLRGWFHFRANGRTETAAGRSHRGARARDAVEGVAQNGC